MNVAEQRAEVLKCGARGLVGRAQAEQVAERAAVEQHVQRVRRACEQQPVAVRHVHVPTCSARLTHSHSTTACASARRRRTSSEPRARHTRCALRQVELRTRALNHIRARVLQQRVLNRNASCSCQ